MPTTIETAETITAEAPSAPLRTARLSRVGSGFDGGALSLVVWLVVLVVVLWAVARVATDMGSVRYVQSLA